VEQGAQATIEMQKEAKRVQEENRLLRTVLRNQGLDEKAIQHALEAAKQAAGGDVLPQVSESLVYISLSQYIEARNQKKKKIQELINLRWLRSRDVLAGQTSTLLVNINR
jgi:hypothetical protein